MVLQSQGPLGLSLQDPRLGTFCSMTSHPRSCLLLWDRKPTGFQRCLQWESLRAADLPAAWKWPPLTETPPCWSLPSPVGGQLHFYN